MTSSPNGTFDTTGARPSVRFERDLAHPPTDVWRSLVEPDELARWFPSAIETDRWAVGAALTFVFRAGEGPTLTGQVLELDEPTRLVYTWGPDTLRFDLTPIEQGTHLTFVTEIGDPGTTARTAAGWQVCLLRLAGEDVADGAWKPLFARYTAEVAPVLGAQEGPPPAALT